MASEREICLRCGLPLATRADIGTLEPGDDAGLCWSIPTIGGCICETVDWPAAVKRMAIALGMSSTSTIEEVEARVSNARDQGVAAEARLRDLRDAAGVPARFSHIEALGYVASLANEDLAKDWLASLEAARAKGEPIDIVFARGSGPDLIFVEVESPPGRSVKVGQWLERDGFRVLRIGTPATKAATIVPDLGDIVHGDVEPMATTKAEPAEPAPTCQEPQSDWLRCGRPLPCPRHDPTCAVCREAIGDRPSTQGYADGLWRHDTCASEPPAAPLQPEPTQQEEQDNADHQRGTKEGSTGREGGRRLLPPDGRGLARQGHPPVSEGCGDSVGRRSDQRRGDVVGRGLTAAPLQGGRGRERWVCPQGHEVTGDFKGNCLTCGDVVERHVGINATGVGDPSQWVVDVRTVLEPHSPDTPIERVLAYEVVQRRRAEGKLESLRALLADDSEPHVWDPEGDDLTKLGWGAVVLARVADLVRLRRSGARAAVDALHPAATPTAPQGPTTDLRWLREGLNDWANRLLVDRSGETVEAAVRALWLYRDVLDGSPAAPQGPCLACGWALLRHPEQHEEPPLVRGALDAQAEAERKGGHYHTLADAMWRSLFPGEPLPKHRQVAVARVAALRLDPATSTVPQGPRYVTAAEIERDHDNARALADAARDYSEAFEDADGEEEEAPVRAAFSALLDAARRWMAPAVAAPKGPEPGNDALDDFRQQHLDYMEGERPSPPSLDGLSEADRSTASGWLRSLDDARKARPLPMDPRCGQCDAPAWFATHCGKTPCGLVEGLEAAPHGGGAGPGVGNGGTRHD